jgi:hypothetical protein
MNKEQALLKYKGTVDMHILKYYEDAEIYQWYNLNDPDLHPIRTKLPECPDWDKIDGFGKKKEDQVFEKEVVPKKLKQLIKQVKLDVKKNKELKSKQKREDWFYETFWETLESEIKHKELLEWISDQWYYKTYGKWVFINGKPTYVPGNHWFYLNYWSLEEVSSPEYRDRDREWFWVMQYFKNDTTVPIKVKDENGKEVLLHNDDGSLQLEDVGYRTVEGVIITKSRRSGDTTKATCDIFCDTIMKRDAHCGIQGDKEDTGEQVFKTKLQYAYDRLLPIWKLKMNHNVESALLFNNGDVDECVNARIDYTSSHPAAYDGQKLYRYYADEPGKLERYSVHSRHMIVRECLRLGTKITGFSIYTTTVNDMDVVSGQEFEKLCKDSFYDQRGSNKYTNTGMVVIHFKGDHGREGFVGRYGESVSGDPTEEQLKYIELRTNSDGKYIGAREDILLRREQFKKQGRFDEVAKEKRLYSLSFKEAFSPPANNVYFNMGILEQREMELDRDNTAAIRGNFVGDPAMFVNFQPDVNGRFLVSKLLSQGSNQKYSLNGDWYPSNPNIYVASADPFKNDKDRLQGYQASDGGGAVLWMHDPRVDPEDKPLEQWSSGIFVCTYNHRPPTTEEFCEDMLKMSVYYGALMYPENNIDHVWKHFVKKGFSGYLLYDTDPDTGRPKAKPGFHSGGDMKQKLFNLTRNHIEMHGRRENHIDYIRECLAIRDPSQMTKYDLFTACGGCLLGTESSYGEYLQEDAGFDIKDVLGW